MELELEYRITSIPLVRRQRVWSWLCFLLCGILLAGIPFRLPPERCLMLYSGYSDSDDRTWAFRYDGPKYVGMLDSLLLSRHMSPHWHLFCRWWKHLITMAEEHTTWSLRQTVVMPPGVAEEHDSKQSVLQTIVSLYSTITSVHWTRTMQYLGQYGNLLWYNVPGVSPTDDQSGGFFIQEHQSLLLNSQC